MSRENVPLGYFAVPLNIMCSSIWERPARPITSFLDPTLYHTCTVATGALGTSTSNTFMPFDSTNSEGSTAAAGPAWRRMSNEARMHVGEKRWIAGQVILE